MSLHTRAGTAEFFIIHILTTYTYLSMLLHLQASHPITGATPSKQIIHDQVRCVRYVYFNRYHLLVPPLSLNYREDNEVVGGVSPYKVLLNNLSM